MHPYAAWVCVGFAVLGGVMLLFRKYRLAMLCFMFSLGVAAVQLALFVRVWN
jgi:hypothetical protein